jgi:hypothetical protein
MAGQGSSGNVLAAIASFLIPGLGQLVQGRAFGTEANLGEIGFDAFVDGIVREYRTRGAETVKGSMAK